jgi:hypothetical protein
MYLPTIKSENVNVCLGGKHVLRRGRVREQSRTAGKSESRRGTATRKPRAMFRRFRVRVTLPFAFSAMANLTKEE